MIASTSSQLAVSTSQADFQVHFYGDYETDIPRAMRYVRDKLKAVRRAYEAANARRRLWSDLNPPLPGGQGSKPGRAPQRCSPEDRYSG